MAVAPPSNAAHRTDPPATSRPHPGCARCQRRRWRRRRLPSTPEQVTLKREEGAAGVRTRAELVVEDDGGGAAGRQRRLDLLHLAAADVGARVDLRGRAQRTLRGGRMVGQRRRARQRFAHATRPQPPQDAIDRQVRPATAAPEAARSRDQESTQSVALTSSAAGRWSPPPPGHTRRMQGSKQSRHTHAGSRRPAAGRWSP